MEYTIRDLILDRQNPEPRFVTRYELHTLFVDGHQLPRRRFLTELQAKDICNRIRIENANGYMYRGRWFESALIRCDYVPVKVATMFRLRPK